MDRVQILERNPIVPFLESRGVTLRGSGDTLKTNRCALVEHKQGHFCVDITPSKGLWNCYDCDAGGSVIDWLVKGEGITAGEALKRLGGAESPAPASKPAPAPLARNGGSNGKLVKTYDYTDETGKLLFQVARFEPKDFRQRAPDGKGGWLYKLDGVRRVPYNLPAVMKADFVFICEGEKDADTLNALGFVATTNCGGAKKWEDTYTPFFRGKDVAILPDSDKAGGEHRDLLREKVGKVAKGVRIIEMPDGLKDVTEFIETFEDPRDGGKELVEMLERAEVFYRGESVPVHTMAELEEEYRAHIKRAATHRLSLGDWLPAFRQIRPLVPGEVVSILAGTGCGKTMCLQNLALNTRLETLLFETELPGTLTFERFAAMTTKSSGGHVESMYRAGSSVDWRRGGATDHILTCHKSKMTPNEMARIIRAAELKTSRRPVLVLVDYIQLIEGDGGSRYERTSGVAEQLKVVAKDTNTIVVVASQIGRPQSKDKQGKSVPESREVRLTDGKDSGSIENSSGIVLGGWRDAEDPDRLWLKVLKNTKGISGLKVACRINESLIIKQESQDLPTP